MSQHRDRRSTLVQALPQAGWEAHTPEDEWPEGSLSRRQQIDQLLESLRARHPEVAEHAARNRFALLLFYAARLLDLGLPEGKKPTTWLDMQIKAVLALPEDQAIAHLQQPAQALRRNSKDDAADDPPPIHILIDTIDLRLEAEDPTFRPDLLVGPEEREELGRRRYSYLKEHQSELMPATTRGREAYWGTIAELTAEALIDLTGQWPGRSVSVVSKNSDRSDGEEGGWGLVFFQSFVAMVIASRPPDPALRITSTVKVWRDALQRLDQQGRRPGPPRKAVTQYA